MDKQLIARRFARRLPTYRDHATVQRQMADRLLTLLAEFTGGRTRFARIFEFGCGAGVLSEKLAAALEYDRLLLNDLAPECAGIAARLPRAEFAPGDVETAAALPAAVDLIASNAAVQWLADPARFFAAAAQALTPGGILAFSSFAPGNLSEISQLTGAGLEYPPPETLKSWLERNFFRVESHTETVELEFASPLEALRHLRDTGVNALRTPPFWTKDKLKNFCGEYERRFGRNGRVVLGYRPLYFLAQKETA